MYRVIIPGTFAIGEFKSSSLGPHLIRKLVDQFSASPRCSEIVLEDSIIESKDNPKATSFKRFESSGEWKELLNLIITHDISHFKHIPLKNTDSVVHFSSISQHNKISTHVQNISSLYPLSRISVFEYGRIMNSDAGAPELAGRRFADKAKDLSYPLLSQFLHARYREIEAKHLAQAVRLNYETCERMLITPSDLYTFLAEYADPHQKIEYLNFVDCMKIIGLEEKI